MRVRTNKINLLPKEYIHAEKMRLGLIIIGGILMLEVALFVIFVAMPPKTEIQETVSRLDEVSMELTDSRFADVNQVVKQLEDAKVEMDEWSQKYADLKKESFISRRVLDSLLSRLPIDLVINKLSILPESEEGEALEKTISIEGIAQDVIPVLNYATILESVYGAGTTSYEVEYNEERGVYEYKINVSIPVEPLESEENQEVIGPEVIYPEGATSSTSEANDGGDNE